MQDTKMRQKFSICAPSHNLSGYLRNQGMYRQSEKKLVKEQYVHMSSQYRELRPING